MIRKRTNNYRGKIIKIPTLVLNREGIVINIVGKACGEYEFFNVEDLNKHYSEIDFLNNLEMNFIDFIENIKENNPQTVLISNYNIDSQNSIPIEIKAIKLNIERKIFTVILWRDISKGKKIKQKIRKLAYIDKVTKLPNRNKLNNVLDFYLKSCRKEEKAALIYIDLDDFKNYNDIYGHEFGDKLLYRVSLIIKEVLYDKYALSRIGGDEFIIFMKNILTKEEVQEIAEKIMTKFERPFSVSNKLVFLSVSMGIAFYPKDGLSKEELMRGADIAMYSAKHAGKNKYRFYDKDLAQKIINKNILLNDMKRALVESEFEMYYQPIVNIETKKCESVEALIRWNHPKHGFISPSEFIPISEETRIIIPLGEWIIINVLEQIKKWDEIGMDDFKISINVSSIQLLEANFVEKIIAIINEKGIKHDRIILEITERFLFDSIDEVNRLVETGINISLDDFGTGYSSLNCLRKMPINSIKIDKSFIVDLNNNNFDKALIDTIIFLAHKANLKVVAEGVETISQLQYLINSSCDKVQGYLFAHPLSPKSLEEKYKETENFTRFN